MLEDVAQTGSIPAVVQNPAGCGPGQPVKADLELHDLQRPLPLCYDSTTSHQQWKQYSQ